MIRCSDLTFVARTLVLFFLALLAATDATMADTVVMPARRFSTQELVRWNAAVRAVPPERWAEIDAMLDEHRAIVRRQAIATAISEDPLEPGQPRRVVRIDSMQDLERIARQLVARLDAQRMREREFVERLRTVVGEETGSAVNQLIAAHALGAARDADVSAHSLPQVRLPDVESLLRELDVSPEAAAAARHALVAALPRLTSLAERLSTACVRWRAPDPFPGNQPTVSQELRRAHWEAENPVILETRKELDRELARTRRAIVQSLPGAVQDEATRILYDQAASEHRVLRAIPAVRGALRRMSGLDLKSRRAAMQVVDQGVAEFQRARLEFIEGAEKSLRETGEIDEEAMEALDERLKGVITRGQVQLGLALGLAPMAKFTRFLESDGQETQVALADLIGADEVEGFLAELDPDLVEHWSGRPSHDESFYEVGWGNLAEVPPVSAVDVVGVMSEGREVDLELLLAGHAAEWQRRVVPLQEAVAALTSGAVVEFRDGRPPEFEAMAASHLADQRRLEGLIEELDAALFAALAGMEGVDPIRLDELRVQRTIARYSGRSRVVMWWSGHGSSMPNAVDPLLIVSLAELDETDRMIARLVVDEHSNAIISALRARHDVASQRVSLMSAFERLRQSIWHRMRQAPDEGADLQRVVQGLGEQRRRAIGLIGAAALATEREWQETLGALRADWAAAVDPDAAAWLESVYCREAYPQLAFDGPKRTEAIILAADAAGSAEDRAAVIAVAARLDAEIDALMARSVAAIEAMPLTEIDYRDDRWNSWARWELVQEHMLQRSELDSRAVRDAVLILGEEKLARLPRLRGPYERDPYE